MQTLMNETLQALIEGRWAPSYADRFIAALDTIIPADPRNRLVMEAQVAITIGIMVTPAPDELRAAAQPCFQSPVALRLGKTMNISSHDDILDIVETLLTRKARIESMEMIDALRQIEDIVRAHGKQYPTAGLSFGYIGNISKNEDDRAWMIFTSLHDSTGRRLSFGHAVTARLPELLDQIEQRFRPWLEERIISLGKAAA